MTDQLRPQAPVWVAQSLPWSSLLSWALFRHNKTPLDRLLFVGWRLLRRITRDWADDWQAIGRLLLSSRAPVSSWERLGAPPQASVHNKKWIYHIPLWQEASTHATPEVLNWLESRHAFAAMGEDIPAGPFLHAALISGNTSALAWGLNRGFDHNSVCASHKTLLWQAVHSNNTEAAALLLAAGASWYDADLWGHSAAKLALTSPMWTAWWENRILSAAIDQPPSVAVRSRRM